MDIVKMNKFHFLIFIFSKFAMTDSCEYNNKRRTHMLQKPALVAAIHDLSGFGRCSLSVILPCLSAMGIQVCAVPTAVLSTHTGGLGDVTIRDQMCIRDRDAAASEWYQSGH